MKKEEGFVYDILSDKFKMSQKVCAENGKFECDMSAPSKLSFEKRHLQNFCR